MTTIKEVREALERALRWAPGDIERVELHELVVALDGMVLVPKLPTDKMLNAGAAHLPIRGGLAALGKHASAIYRAMLDAGEAK